MRYLGIDYGKKRIGLALSDPEGKMAFPRAVVATMDEVIAIIRADEVRGIVIGIPKHPLNSDSRATKEIRTFADALSRAVQLPVVFEDEMFTTKIAEHNTAKNLSDASAAAVILQSYLDKQV